MTKAEMVSALLTEVNTIFPGDPERQRVALAEHAAYLKLMLIKEQTGGFHRKPPNAPKH